MDNVKYGWLLPEEDQIALAILAGGGVRLAAVFPRNRDWYQSFFQRSPVDGTRHRLFREALECFTRKLVGLYKRRLLLKTPSHGMMILDILKVFPKARFVGIFRNPIDQFASLNAMLNSGGAGNYAALQATPGVDTTTMLSEISLYLDRYFGTRALIPKGQLTEICYEDLIAREEQVLEKIYLGLGLEARAANAMSSAQVGPAYVKNKHPEPDPELKKNIAKIYAPYLYSGLFNVAGMPRA